MRKQVISLLSVMFLVIVFSGLVAALESPTNLENTEITTNSFVANWAEVENATEYNVTLQGSEDIKNTQDHNYSFTNLSPNETYTWKVKAINESHSSDWSRLNITTLPLKEPGLKLEANPSWEEDVFTEVTIEGKNCPEGAVCNLYKEGEQVSNPYINDSFEVRDYVFEYNTTGSADYDEGSISNTLKIRESFCEYANTANLKIDRFDISVEEGFGDRDNFWYPLDEIEIDFRLDARDFKVEELEDIKIEICIFDKKDERCVFDERDMDLSDDDFDMEEGDRKTITATFKIDPDNLVEGNTDYEVRVKATGITDDDDDDLNNLDSCFSDYKEIEIITDDEFIIIDNIDMPEVLTCGQEFDIFADVWNIYDDDLDEDEIFIRIFNNKLGINEEIDFPRIRSFRKEKLQTTLIGYSDLTEIVLKIPEDAEEGWYTMELIVYDDEDMANNDIYENDEGDKAIYTHFFQVAGCPGIKDASLELELITPEEEIIEGEEVEIKATVTNTGEEETLYTLEVKDNEGFSNVRSISQSAFTLDEGESKDVTIILKLDEESAGEHIFKVAVSFNDEEVSQEAEISIKESVRVWNVFENFADSMRENWFIWIIAIVNIVLILAIIIVVIKMSGKEKRIE